MMIDNLPSANWRDYGWNNAYMDRLCFYIKVKFMKIKIVQSLSIRKMIEVLVTNELNKRDLSF